jgi:5'-nucleotidase
VQILLTNDDGIYAPGLAALERALTRLGDVAVVAPATEQSGVGHSITFLTPLIVKEIFDGPQRRGWAVEGSPADSVKIGISEFCPQRPELVVSGINGGLNAGINVLYSGTVAAAIEGAFFGITSIAVSLQWDEHPQFERAAEIAIWVIEKILQNQAGQAPALYNVNIPTLALNRNDVHVRVVPMGIEQYGEKYEKRFDPRGRPYFWVAGDLPVPDRTTETDLTELEKGFVTVTPLHFDLTKHGMIKPMQKWDWGALG